MPKEVTSNYNKDELLGDLKLAGFDDYLAKDIVDKVDKHKQKSWTYEHGREEAIRQAQKLLENGNLALDTFRAATLSSTGQRDYANTESYAERIADSRLG